MKDKDGKAVIARIWRGHTTRERADEYEAYRARRRTHPTPPT